MFRLCHPDNESSGKSFANGNGQSRLSDSARQDIVEAPEAEALGGQGVALGGDWVAQAIR
jgi:hypothetical protein